MKGKIIYKMVPLHPSVIILVGVVHVMNIAEAIKHLLDRYEPDAVALELDSARLYALLHPEAVSDERGPLIARLLARLERNIAGKYGTTVGGEMLTAYEEALRRGIRVLLVDRPIGETLRRLRAVPLREKLKLYANLIAYPLLPGKKRTVGSMLGSVDTALEEFRREFPGYHRVLVEERNAYIASRIADGEKYGTVMAFIGDAHIPGLKGLLPGAEVIRLSEVLKLRKGYNDMSKSGVCNERD